MIGTIAAFDLLKEHYDVDNSVQDFVMKRLRGSVTNSELLTVIENGVSGQYGKIYKPDAQTILGWVEKYQRNKNSNTNYLTSPLAPVEMNHNEIWNWSQEANKCFNAYISGVSETDFHPAVYDNMVLDGKLKLGDYEKYYKIPFDAHPDLPSWNEEIKKVNQAKQKVLRDIFSQYKSRGYQTVYFI